MATLLDIFMGLALAHFQKCWLLSRNRQIFLLRYGKSQTNLARERAFLVMNDTTMETVANYIEVALDIKMDSYGNITLPEGTVSTLGQ